MPKQGAASGAATGSDGAAGPPPLPTGFFGRIRPGTAAVLCYIPWFGWIAAILVLASERFKRDLEVRFHAFQGLYLFLAWLIVDWVISPVFSIGHHMGRFGMPPFAWPGAGLLNLLILAGWIFMMIKASKGEHYRLPLVGDLAERSAAEQRI